MGLNTLVGRGNTIIDASWFNDLITAMKGDFVPRNALGVVTGGAGSLGSADFPWRSLHVASLVLDGVTLDASQLAERPHRIRSGKAKASGYPDFLAAAGAGAGLSASLVTTPSFEAIVNSASLSLTGSLTFTGLTAAPSSANTCLVNDSGLSGQSFTKTLGEWGHGALAIDTVGAGIIALNGQVAAFKKGNEVFLALVDTSASRLLPIYRGWAGTARETLSDNDTLTLLMLNTLLVKSDGVVRVASTYFPESVVTLPAAGTAGKVYLERSSGKHAYDDGGTVSYDYLIVGWAICDSADCKWVQPYDFGLNWKVDQDVAFRVKDSTTVTVAAGSSTSVAGGEVAFPTDVAMTQASNMDAGEAIAATSLFFMYVKPDGGLVFSSVAPRVRSHLTKGLYHPANYYRCVGAVQTDGSSSFVFADTVFVDPSSDSSSHLVASGASNKTFVLPSAKLHGGKTIFIRKTDAGAGMVTVSTITGETLDGDSSLNLRSQYDFLEIVSDGSTWLVKGYRNSYEFTTTVSDLFPGASVTLRVMRHAGKRCELFVRAGSGFGTKTSASTNPTTDTAVPAEFKPTVGTRFGLSVFNAGGWAMSSATVITATGKVQWGSPAAGGLWSTSSSDVVLNESCAIYYLS